MKKLLIASFIIATVFAACKKYEEGPFISFRSREERVANTWVYDKVIVDGEDATAQLIAAQVIDMGTKITLTKNGSISISNPSWQNVSNGTWKFKNKDEEILIDFENPAAHERWRIIKLKEKELWYRPLNVPALAGNTWEIHLKAK